MIELTEEQVLYFRARRTHLAGPGAPDAVAAARAMLGAQAQQPLPALLALSQRTKGRPTAAAIEKMLEAAPRRLVRTWGQRETLHVFDPAFDWPYMAAARPQLAPAGRRGAMPTDEAVQTAKRTMEKVGGPVTRSDLFPILPRKLVREAAEKVGAGDPARRLAAGRLLWILSMRGEACMAGKVGTEQMYALRTHWFPKLKWPRLNDPVRAAAELARRYLSSYGPANATDVAHHFGARVKDARVWIDTLEGDGLLTPVSCGERKGLVAIAEDARALRTKPPAEVSKWPARLLPLWDSMMMGHADKSWLVPDAAERKLVWRKAAMVAAVVLARGRVVATWTHTKRSKRLDVKVEPLGGWRRAKHAAQVEREAKAVAKHMGVGSVNVTIAD